MFHHHSFRSSFAVGIAARPRWAAGNFPFRPRSFLLKSAERSCVNFRENLWPRSRERGISPSKVFLGPAEAFTRYVQVVKRIYLSG